MKDRVINCIKAKIKLLYEEIKIKSYLNNKFSNSIQEEQSKEEAAKQFEETVYSNYKKIKLDTQELVNEFQKIHDPSKLSEFEKMFNTKKHMIEIEKSCNNFFKTYVKFPTNSPSELLLKQVFDKINIQKTIDDLEDLINIPEKDIKWIGNFINQYKILAIKIDALDFFKTMRNDEMLGTMTSLPYQKIFTFFEAKYRDCNAVLPQDDNLHIAAGLNMLEKLYTFGEPSIEEQYADLIKKPGQRN